MKKILHILTDSNIGGAGTHLLNILKFYDRSRFIIEVALPQGSRLIPLVKETDTKVIEVPHMRDISFSIKTTLALVFQLAREKPTLIHTHASLAGRLAARFLRIPVLYTRHYCVDGGRRSGASFLQDRVIATSPEVEAGLLRSGIKPQLITTINNGVAPLPPLDENERKTIRARYNIPPDAFVVSQIGRLTPVKGHEYSLNAMKLLFDINQNIVLLLAGDGELEAQLKKRIKSEGIKNVYMTGFVSKIHEIHNITDLQLNASDTETSCQVLLEGMSLGIPAVVTNGGGNPLTVPHGQCGLVVPCRDATAIAQAITQIESDPALYKRLSEGALAAYNNNFRAEDMTRKLEAVYEEILK